MKLHSLLLMILLLFSATSILLAENKVPLSIEDKVMLGKSFFDKVWVTGSSSTSARDGLGPLHNSNSCLSCHSKKNRGKLLNKNGKINPAFVVKLIDKIYGKQINTKGTHLVPYEGKIKLDFEYTKFVYFDGEKVILRKPIIQLENLNYGPISKNIMLSARIAPVLYGLGLIAMIKNQDILIREDKEDKNQDGISGRAYRTQQGLGKFAWKADSDSLEYQVAKAAFDDMSLSNPFFPFENCSTRQIKCLQDPKEAKGLDLPLFRINAITQYIKQLPIKQKNITLQSTGKLIASIGCFACHQPNYKIQEKYIYPYSDFLLHNMGEKLKSNNSQLGREWRTAPLWNLSKQDNFLHDARARNIEEAILWHAGEAQSSKNNFMQLSAENRKRIINLLETL